METTVVVTGGAGYIGGVTARLLQKKGLRPIVLDNFSTSHRQSEYSFPVEQVDLSDQAATRRIWEKLPPHHGVIHFAAHALVGESMRQPGLYYRNNIQSALNVAECVREFGGNWIVHSSSCAVYGTPAEVPIHEGMPHQPLSPYGQTKAMVEQILNDMVPRVLHLRYFNPVGAYEGWGEAHDPETHLVPNAVRAALEGTPLKVFGQDYPTADGTCVRDFLHVEDLALAHLAALRALESGEEMPPAINLGAGKGVSVMETIELVQNVTGKTIPLQKEPRRPGDPPELFADIRLAEKYLKWKPNQTLRDAIQSHTDWLSQVPTASL